MALTPDEILNHEFTRKGSKAYVAKEVDTFLDSVNSDYRALIGQYDRLTAVNAQLQARVDQLERQRDEVNQSIIIAQDAANRVRREADEEAKKQITHAQETATQIITDARGKADSESTRLAQENVNLVGEQNRLRGEVVKFRDSFLELLDQQKKLLENQQLDAAVALLPTSQISVDVINADRFESDDDINFAAPVSADHDPDSESVQPKLNALNGSVSTDGTKDDQQSKSTESAGSDSTVVVFPEDD